MKVHAAMKHRSKLHQPEKRQRASRKAKELVWGVSRPEIPPPASHTESMA
jgi:hypothetical protein